MCVWDPNKPSAKSSAISEVNWVDVALGWVDVARDPPQCGT
jgi:hypothetical protein